MTVMVLNGSLHEFILADILQLLSQQKATGKLSLTSDSRSGFLIIQQGMVVAAETDRENLQTKLIICLLTLKRIPEAVVNDLLISNPNAQLDKATAELSARQYMSAQELLGLTRILIEDFSCNLFTWSNGEYRFESLENASPYCVAGVTLSADYVVMEAMRRVDELKRIKLQIQEDMIFVRAQQSMQPFRIPTDLVTVLNNPQEYVLAFVNGMASVGMIAERSIVAIYRLIETLCVLWEQQKVAPLSIKISRSIQAALTRRRDQVSHRLLLTVTSVSVTLLIVVTVLFAGIGIRYAAYRIIPPQNSPAAWTDGSIELAKQKVRIGMLEHETEFGSKPKNERELVEKKILSSRDCTSKR